MKNIWIIIKILSPALITFLISLYLDEISEKFAVLTLGITLSAIQFIKNNTLINKHLRDHHLLKGFVSNQKRKLHSHIGEPHIVSSATIKVHDGFTIENSFNINAISDVGATEVHLHIENPSGKNIIPNIDTDAKQHVSVVATPTTIKISWEESFPTVIYMTAVHGE